MFSGLALKATYSSYEDDMGAEFYEPVLRESVRYDRATAYFSAKALASYAKGLEAFARHGHTYRLIVSAEIPKAEYEQVKKGYELRKSVNAELLSRLREKLTLDEERDISNLAYLISLGIIDIKIAFTQEGIFHDKFGIAEDAEGNIICFRGSNNETAAAFHTNYEAFDITCSWQTSEFDYSKITKSRETFEKLWNNTAENVFVCEADAVLYKEIGTHNKGQLIADPAQLEPNCLLLDYDGVLKFHIKIVCPTGWSALYKMHLRRYTSGTVNDGQIIVFKSNLNYITFRKITGVLERYSEKNGYRFFTTKRLRDYVEERELYIEKRAQLGMDMKRQSETLSEKFREYSQVVDENMSRPLRNKQMWDSFFMCVMKKSGNFSVPGSGKTASVLGVFAYLSAKGLAKRIVMIGPKSAFGSWIDEFQICFAGKKELRLFSSHDTSYKTATDRKRALRYDTGNKNLLLFNYEGIGSYLSELSTLIDQQTLLVFDEAHKVKALNGQRAANAMEVSRNARYTVAMTGTPIPNSYTDIRNILDILFHDEYESFFGFTDQRLRAPSEQDRRQINDCIQPFFCRTTKQELQVPAANPDVFMPIKASEAENKLFRILLMKYAKNKLALIIRLLQLETNPKLILNAIDISDFADILDTTDTVENIDYVDYSREVLTLVYSIDQTAKFSACIEAAKKLWQEQKPSIIWCIFVDSIMRLKSELESAGVRVGYICGSVTLEERQMTLQAFRNGELDVLITNPQTMAESVSLHSVCHNAIYFEYSYNLVHLLQSKDRIHRLGLPAGQYTQYFYLQETFTDSDDAPFSLDEQIYMRLLQKEQTMLEAIENNVLESGSTPEEDLDIIFKGLKL